MGKRGEIIANGDYKKIIDENAERRSSKRVQREEHNEVDTALSREVDEVAGKVGRRKTGG